MRIERGLFEHGVLQRTRRNVCEAVVEGVCAETGPVQVAVRAAGMSAKGRNQSPQVIGQAKRGRMVRVFGRAPSA